MIIVHEKIKISILNDKKLENTTMNYLTLRTRITVAETTMLPTTIIIHDSLVITRIIVNILYKQSKWQIQELKYLYS